VTLYFRLKKNNLPIRHSDNETGLFCIHFIPSKLHPVRDLSVHIFMIYFNIVLPSTPLYLAFLFKFSKQNVINYAFMISPMRNICPSHIQ